MAVENDTSLDRAKKIMRLGAKALDAIVNMPSITLYAPKESMIVSEIKLNKTYASLRQEKHLECGDELAMCIDGVTLFDNFGCQLDKIPAQLVSTERIQEINSIIGAIRRELHELTEEDKDCGW